MMKQFTKIIFAITLMLTLLIILVDYSGCSSINGPKEKVPYKDSMTGEASVKLRTQMRELWSDHVMWTRNVIFCLVDELPGTDQAVKRLLQNQVDIGNSIKPFYGDEAGKKLTEILYAHINISAEVVTAAKSGNAIKLDDANKRWYANADELSEFLCKANPMWNLQDMKMMMREHLKITTDEAVQRIKKDYDLDVAAFDKIHSEILMMADVLTDGIIKQFPEKFSNKNN